MYTSTSRSAWRPRPVQASLQHTHPPAGHARRDAVACSTCSRVFHCIDPPLPAAEREADGWTSCPRRICEDAWPSRGQRAAPSHALSPPSSRPDHRPTPSPQGALKRMGSAEDVEIQKHVEGSGPGSPGPVSATADGHCPSFAVFPLVPPDHRAGAGLRVIPGGPVRRAAVAAAGEGRASVQGGGVRGQGRPGADAEVPEEALPSPLPLLFAVFPSRPARSHCVKGGHPASGSPGSYRKYVPERTYFSWDRKLAK